MPRMEGVNVLTIERWQCPECGHVKGFVKVNIGGPGSKSIFSDFIHCAGHGGVGCNRYFDINGNERHPETGEVLKIAQKPFDEEKLAASIRHILLDGYASIPQNNGMIIDEATKNELYQELQKQFLFNMQFRKVIIQQVDELVKLFQSVKSKN